MLNHKPLIWFLSITFGLAWILFLIPLAFGQPGTPAHQMSAMLCWALAMWAPGLGAIIATRLIAQESMETLNVRRLGPKHIYLWAWLLPPALAILSGILTVLLRLGQFDPTFTMIREAMANAPEGTSISPAMVVAIQVTFALTLAPLLNVIFAMGEELGWRGFLLPRLLPLGQWTAILISGVIWGVWHAPAIIQGLNYPGRPVLGIFLMIIFCVTLGAIFSWLYLQTRSPWAPALAHGSLNATAGLPVLFLKNPDIIFGGTLASITGLVTLALFVGWLVLTHRLPVVTEEALDTVAHPAGV